MVHFKVCSCPKRDMFSEHNAKSMSRKRDATAPPVGKQPSKMVCVRPTPMQTPMQTMVKLEPVTPSPPLSASCGDASPLSMYGQHPNRGLTTPDSEDGAKSEIERITNQMVQMTLTLPRHSALHILRCAYGEVTALMANDKNNPDQYIIYARDIQKQIGKFRKSK